MPSSRLGTFCDKVIEAGWLAAVVAAPLFFNVYSSRVFEPDKLTLVRTIATVMAAAWIIKWLEQRNAPRSSTSLSVRDALILPTLILSGVYLLTTLTSITPRISFLGSYQRLQGTYTTLSYIIIFLMIVQGLRTRRQLDRLVFAIILTSLPIALYGLIQRYRLDPLPWGGDVTVRVASNMGNPIFVAAYLIMAFFLNLGKIVESFRAILTEEEAVVADIVRAAGYVFIGAVQAIAITFAGSRGPYIGMLTGTFAFGLIFLVDLRRQAPDQEAMTPLDAGLAILSAVGTYAIAGIVVGLAGLTFGLVARKEGTASAIGLVLGIIAVVAFWAWLLSNRTTWKWLWLFWVSMAGLMAAILFAANVMPNAAIFAPLRNDPNFGRLANLIETEGGTGKVRTLIWEGNTQLVPPHDPIRFPDGSSDPLNILRPLIGYGPESMYVAYNRFYPPDLAHYESRNASPDRSHNETWDSLVITGVIGLLAYQFLFISFFIYGFQSVGIMPTKRERNLFIALWVGLGLLGGLATIVLRQPKYFGMGVPGGILAAIVLYLVIFSTVLYDREHPITLRPEDRILFAGILASVIAHYIEIHFGIAIASTRTMFWSLAGIMVAVGSGWVQSEETATATTLLATQPAAVRPATPANTPRHKKRRVAQSPPERTVSTAQSMPTWLGSVAGYALVSTIILSTLYYEFVTNAERLSDPTSILWRALTYLALQRRESFAILGMLALVWILATLIGIAELVHSGVFKKAEDWIAGLGLLASISIGASLIFAYGLAGQLGNLTRIQISRLDQLVGVSDSVAGIFNYYYAGIFALLYLAAIALMAEVRRLPSAWTVNIWGAMAIVPALIVVFVWVNYSNLDPIRADIIYKQADPYDKQGQWDASIAHYKHALELASYEDFYYLWLGRAFLEKAGNAQVTPTNLLNEQTQLEGILNLNVQQTATLGRQDLLQAARAVLVRAREINPLNTDHSANLARLYRRWADLSTDPAQKAKQLDLSVQNYVQATNLSPHNAILWNEWATVEIMRGNLDAAEQKLAESLKLDSQFDQTYMILGELYVNTKNYDRAVEMYKNALEITPGLVQAQGTLAYVYAQQGKLAEAIQANLALAKMSPNDPSIWNTRKNLAILYAQTGELQSALSQAQIAASLAPTSPTDYRAELNNYAAQLRAQLAAPPVPTATVPITQ